MRKYYLLTIRKHRVLEFCSTGELVAVLDSLRNYDIDTRTYCLESHGKYKQLHCHALVHTTQRFINFKWLNEQYKEHGLILHLEKVKNRTDDIRRVEGYIHKHCDNHSTEQIQQTHWCNWYKYHYGFND